ncbi:MAG: T9SS type A sorting domain-containing protein, partial [Bacteroidales bacterium]|nr:T9SS type A sorting domain-containing protein [Bacteroidales bacterium]
CDNRSYYGQGVMTSTSDYDANIVEAYMSNNCIVLNVNALYPSNITATLYDVNGKHLLMREYGTAETVSDIIPVSYAPGIYLLKVMVGNRLYAFKLLKI